MSLKSDFSCGGQCCIIPSMEKNNKPLIIIGAIVVGVALIIALAFMLTRDDSETKENTVSENEASEIGENGNDGQQPTPDPEADSQSYTKEELEADLSDTSKTDLEKARHIAEYCVVHEIDGDRAENHCIIWSHNSSSLDEEFCDDKEVIAGDWCGSEEAQTRFRTMLEEVGLEEDSSFAYLGGILDENSDPELLTQLIKYRAFIFVPQSGLEIFFVR